MDSDGGYEVMRMERAYGRDVRHIEWNLDAFFSFNGLNPATCLSDLFAFESFRGLAVWSDNTIDFLQCVFKW